MFTTIERFAENSETLKEVRSNVKEMSLFKEIGIFIGLFIVLQAILFVANIMALSLTPNEDIFWSLVGFIIVPIVIYLFVTKIEKRSWRSIGFSKGNAVSSTLTGLLIGFLMFCAVVILGMLLGQYSFNGFDSSTIIFLIPSFIIFAIQCFGEEIYTRGWTMTYFSKRHSVITAIIINCIIFVVPHLGNSGFDFLSIVNIFLFGILFAVMFWRFDNIWICCGAHTAWNFSQGIIFGFHVSGLTTPSLLKFSQVNNNIIGGGVFGPESGLIATLVVVIVLILMVYYTKK
ncbi:CPBP family intramembrane glutamic endopeptidase [Methanobrevibacter sp.]|uniref:CPBP family intramembrane glutamic endopeptidase n=1 Tax=Methanobrevibacter sp. TaxID=66852 RepID=UPI00388DCE55